MSSILQPYARVAEGSLGCKSSLIDPTGASFLFQSWWRHSASTCVMFPLLHFSRRSSVSVFHFFGNALACSSLYVSLTWYFPLGYSPPCLWACEMSQSEEKAPQSLWKPLVRLYENVLRERHFQGWTKKLGGNWIGWTIFGKQTMSISSSLSCVIVLRILDRGDVLNSLL